MILTVGVTVTFAIANIIPMNLTTARFARRVKIGITGLAITIAIFVSSARIVANLTAAMFTREERFVITLLTVPIPTIALAGILLANLTIARFALDVLLVITGLTVVIAIFATGVIIRNFATVGTMRPTGAVGTIAAKHATVNLNRIGRISVSATFRTLDPVFPNRHNRFHPYR